MEKEKIRNELIAVFEETMDCKFRKNARIFPKPTVKLRKLHGFLMKAGAICGIVEQNVSARGERP